MSNDYYNHGSVPATGSSLSSATMRAEFDAIATGMDKLPPLTGNNNEVVVVNAGATGQSSVPRAALIDTTIVDAADKATPVDADLLPLVDSAAANALKKLTWGNVKATLKTYFDSVTTTLTNKTLTSPIISGGTINGATVGATTPSTGAFTTLSASGAITGSTNLMLPIATAAVGFGPGATEQVYRFGNALRVYVNSADVATFSPTGLAVTGSITSTVPAAGSFTTVSASGGLTVNGAGIVSNTTGANTPLIAGETGVSQIIIGNGGSSANFIDADTTNIRTGAAATIATFSSTGLAVTGALSATGNLGLNSGTAVTFNSLVGFYGDADQTVVRGRATNGTIFQNAAGTIQATLDAAGNLGLGVVPSAWVSSWKALQIGGSGALASRTDVYSTALGQNWIINAAGNDIYIGAAHATLYQQVSGTHVWRTAPSGTAGNPITFTQAMTLDASGNQLLGTTSAGAGIGFGTRLAVDGAATHASTFKTSDATKYLSYLWNSATSGDNLYLAFAEGGAAAVRGSIDYNRTGVVVRYNTTSDATLKTKIGPAPQAKSLEILGSTVLQEYFWNEDATQKKQIGVFAQELYKTFPGAVSVGGEYTEELPAVLDDEGNEVTPATTVTKYRPWTVDKTAWTFHLIAGYQYLKVENETLKGQLSAMEARLAALEAA